MPSAGRKAPGLSLLPWRAPALLRCSHPACPAPLPADPAAVRGSLPVPALPEELHRASGLRAMRWGPADGHPRPARRERPHPAEPGPAHCGPRPGARAGCGGPRGRVGHSQDSGGGHGGHPRAAPQPVPLHWHGAGGSPRHGALPGPSTRRATDTVPTPGQTDGRRGQPAALGLCLPQRVAAPGGCGGFAHPPCGTWGARDTPWGGLLHGQPAAPTVGRGGPVPPSCPRSPPGKSR